MKRELKEWIRPDCLPPVAVTEVEAKTEVVPEPELVAEPETETEEETKKWKKKVSV